MACVFAPSSSSSREATEALWGEVFKTCVEVSDDKDINVRALLGAIDKEMLLKLADKLFNIASSSKPCVDMKKVATDIEFNYEKTRKASLSCSTLRVWLATQSSRLVSSLVP